MKLCGYPLYLNITFRQTISFWNVNVLTKPNEYGKGMKLAKYVNMSMNVLFL